MTAALFAALAAAVAAAILWLRAGRALRVSRAVWSLVNSGASDVLWHLDLARGSVTVSSRFWDWLPRPSGGVQELLERWRDFVHPGDWEQVRRAVRGSMDGEAFVFDIEFRAVLPHGERWLRLRAQASATARHQLAGSLSDVTELKELRLRLRDWSSTDSAWLQQRRTAETEFSPAETVLERRLEEAVANRRLDLVFQPQLRLSDGRIAGFEALSRWTDGELGPVSPSEFIPAAERLGLIAPLGNWALTEACVFLARQSPPFRDELTLAVNVSVLQLRDPSFAARAEKLVRNAGLSPASIELEITETVLIPSYDEAVTQLTRLRDVGFRIALDDFGQGYSSLSYLRALPLDTIKIDKAFIGDPALLGTIVRLGRLLNLRVVAEGVESADQLAPLIEHGCDFVQGYYFSLPMAADQAQRFLEDPSRSSRSAR